MARTYKRDANGRFASGGGGSSGGGKAKAPMKAKAAYKAASSKAREAKMMAGGRTSVKGLKGRTDAGAQRIRESVKVAQAAAARVRAMERNRGRKRSNRKK